MLIHVRCYCRLAMLGFIAAVGAELATGRKVSQQIAIAPGPIAGVFLLFTVASMIPILKVCALQLLAQSCLLP